jgi:uncharacterized protein YndB with AHSA1/START domain
MSADTLTEDRVLRLERIIATTPETLYGFWTRPALLVRWWGPEGYTTPHYDLDVREGGRWRTTMHRPDGTDLVVSGIYRVLEPPRRLSFTWAWDDDAGLRGHETEVTVTFEPVPGGTRMVLTQQAFRDKDGRDRHREGWSSSFVCLEREAKKPAS